MKHDFCMRILLLKLLFLSLFLFAADQSFATKVSGIIYDADRKILPYTTVSVKSKSVNVISNEKGFFSFEVNPGKYTIVFMHVGYKSRELEIIVSEKNLDLEITMELNSLTLDEIMIKPGGEDPAYEIIRNAIRSRKDNAGAIASFSCQSYLKGVVRTNAYPETFMGRKIDFEDGDTSKQKIIFLSETIADIHFRQPDETRVNVISTKVSGQSNGFGLATPFLLTFYDNIVSIPRVFNPRGFISPIADGALSFYKYKYLGAFSENGFLVNRIQVIPKRDWEPLFNGYIQIIEDSWKLHAVDLYLDKESQLELANKLNISQQYEYIGFDNWTLKSQNIELSANIFGFSADGIFTTLYSQYRVNNEHSKNTFGKTLIRFDSLSNKRNDKYWAENRPLPLLSEEIADYLKKDSLELKRQDPRYLDSLDKIQNKITPTAVFLNGLNFSKRSSSASFSLEPFLKDISFNTVEGWSIQASGSFRKDLKGRKEFSVSPVIRYGTSNGHLNAYLNSRYQFGKKYANSIGLGFGKRIFQFNNRNPIPQIMNTFSTLLDGNNYMKIYESHFFQLNYFKVLGDGFDADIAFSYQKRSPLENLKDINLWTDKEKLNNITPNYPTEIAISNMSPNTSSTLGLRIRYRPGEKYVEYPDRVVRAFSKSPLFTLQIEKGLPQLLASVSNFAKWKFSISHDINFKMGGEFRYMLQTGGFFNKTFVALPDYNHFSGNLTRKANPYVRSFQVAPFYALSNTDPFFTALFLEHSFNGLLTNKIPLLRKLNLRLITGANMIHTGNRNYAEAFVGFDNILKIFRVDYVWGTTDWILPRNGIKIGIRGFNNLFND